MNKHLGEKCSNEKEIDGGDETFELLYWKMVSMKHRSFFLRCGPRKIVARYPSLLVLWALFSYFSMDLNESGADGRLRYCFSCRTFTEAQEAWQVSKAPRSMGQAP